MKKVKSNFIVPGVTQPFQSGTWRHLQESFSDIFRDKFRSQLNTTGLTELDSGSGLIALTPLITTNNFIDWTVYNGFVFYNDEFYKIDEISADGFSAIAPNIPVLQLAPDEFLTAADADPVEMSNGSFESVHLIKKMEFVAALPGTGVVDYDNVIFFKNLQNIGDVTTDNLTINTGSGIDNGGGNLRTFSKNWTHDFDASQTFTDNNLGVSQAVINNMVAFTVTIGEGVDGPHHPVSTMPDPAGGTTPKQEVQLFHSGLAQLSVEVLTGGFFDAPAFAAAKISLHITYTV